MFQSDDRRGFIVYWLLIVVFVGSFAVAYVSPVTEFSKDFLAAPGVVALLAMVWQALRDKQAYDRNREFKEREQGFTLGIVSHMAQVVFDKQAEFCERYAEAFTATVLNLRNWPNVDAMNAAQNLSQLRDKYSLWIPEDLQQKLSTFESEVRKIGSETTAASLTAAGADKVARVDRAYGRLLKVLGYEPIVGDIKSEITAATVIESLKKVLGAADYIILRDYALKAAKRWTEKS